MGFLDKLHVSSSRSNKLVALSLPHHLRLTMAASFVGLPVLIQLRSGGTAKGTVKSVDGSAGTIILSEGEFSRLYSRATSGSQR